MNFTPFSHHNTKIIFKWTINLTMRTTTINFLEENIGVNLCDLCSDF